MKNTVARYSLTARTAWLCLAVMLVIFCGPVKKLIEQRFSPAIANSSSISFDKKLHTWYREKKEITPLVHVIAQHTTDVEFLFFVTASFIVLSLFIRNNKLQKTYAPLLLTGQGVPLYLYLRKLQV